MNNEQRKLLTDLKKLRDRANDPVVFSKTGTVSGICGYVSGQGLNPYHKELHRVFRKWKNHSGDDIYPVPHPTIKDPEEAYREVRFQSEEKADAMVMWQGGYGKMRRQLLDFSIWYLEANFLKRVWYAMWGVRL